MEDDSTNEKTETEEAKLEPKKESYLAKKDTAKHLQRESHGNQSTIDQEEREKRKRSSPKYLEDFQL